jgi:hypothetical protein
VKAKGEGDGIGKGGKNGEGVINTEFLLRGRFGEYGGRSDAGVLYIAVGRGVGGALAGINQSNRLRDKASQKSLDSEKRGSEEEVVWRGSGSRCGFVDRRFGEIDVQMEHAAGCRAGRGRRNEK